MPRQLGLRLHLLAAAAAAALLGSSVQGAVTFRLGDGAPLTGAAGRTLDIPVTVDAGTRPLGALEFELRIEPPAGVLRYMGALATGLGAGGALAPLENPADLDAGSPIPVRLLNAGRAEARAGEHVACLLRFTVTGATNATCRIALANPRGWTTAVIPGADSNAVASIALDPVETTFTVSAAPPGALFLDPMAAAVPRGGIVPVRLMAETVDAVSALDVTVTCPTNAGRIVAVETGGRNALVFDPAELGTGALRLRSVYAGHCPAAAGLAEQATLWVDVGPVATVSNLALGLTVHTLLSGFAPHAVGVAAGSTAATFPIAPRAIEWAADLPAAADFRWGEEVIIPIRARIGDVVPGLLAARVEVDTGAAELLRVEPSDPARGTVTLDPAALAAGAADFLYSRLEGDAPQTNRPARLVNVVVRPRGALGTAGALVVGMMGCGRGVEYHALACSLSPSDPAAEQGTNAVVRPSAVDTDRDRMPDWWEYAHIGNITNMVADADPDRDGFCNRREYLADTDPGDEASCLRIKRFTWHPEVRVWFDTSAQRLYTVQTNANPRAASGWAAVPACVGRAGTGGEISVLDHPAGKQPRTYRLVAAPLP